MRSGSGDYVDPDTAALWRTFQACQLYSCTPAELDEVPASTIDWHLAMARMQNELQEEASRG